MGLPPYPTWWAWYGEPYRQLVGGRLTTGTVTGHRSGLLHELSDVPAHRDELAERVAQHAGPDGHWVPPELLAVRLPHDDRPMRPGIARAAVLPDLPAPGGHAGRAREAPRTDRP
jgi:hypothetical protein